MEKMPLNINLTRISEKALRLLSRYLKTDVRYLAYGSFWLVVGKITGMAVAFILSFLYARYLTKDIYGDFRYILSLFGIFAVFAIPGMATSVVRSVARAYEGTFRKAFKIILISSTGITLTGIGASLFFFTWGKYTLGYGLLIGALFMPFVEAFGLWRGYLDGKREFLKKTKRNIFAHTFYGIAMTITVILIYFFKLSPILAVPLLIGAYAMGNAIPHTIFIIKTLHASDKNSPIEPRSISYGLHSSIATIPTTVATYLDSLILYGLLGPVPLATYSFAIAIPEQMKALINTTADVTFPKLSEKMLKKKNIKSLQNTLLPKIGRACLFAAIIVAIYFLFAPLIFDTFFPRYNDSVFFSQIFALSLVFLPLSVLDKTLKAEGNIKKIYVYNTIAPFIRIAAFIMLIPIFGIWGAVAGRMIGRFSNYIFLIVLFKI